MIKIPNYFSFHRHLQKEYITIENESKFSRVI
nr:MAG TPA: hypothetical protein [Caudoviricetes sp.]